MGVIFCKHISLIAKCAIPHRIDNGRIETNNHYDFEYPYSFSNLNITCDFGYATNGRPVCQSDRTWNPEPGCSKGSDDILLKFCLFSCLHKIVAIQGIYW